MKLQWILLLLTILVFDFQNAKSDIIIDCKKAKVDVVFVLDSSFSVGPHHWKFQLKFLNDLVEPFTIGNTKARFAVIVFNTKVRYVVMLRNKMTKKQLKAKISKLRYTIGLTFTGEALMKARSVLKKEGRKKAHKLIILVTDGKSNGWYNPVPIANQLKKEKVMIISVGITHRINKIELDNISSSGHFIFVKQFKMLRGIITKEVQQKTCRTALVRVCKKQESDLTFILDSSTSIGHKRWHQTIDFVERVTDPLFIGTKSTRVALMTFNTTPKLQFLYKKFLNKVVLLKKGIHQVHYTEGLTYMGEALRYFRKKIYPAMRKGVSKIVVLITDGYANGKLNTMKEARILKRLGVKFITVGVTGHINKKLLLKISSSKKLYSVTQLHAKIVKIQHQVCKQVAVKK